VLLNACNDIALPVNTRETRYMKIGRHRGIITNERIRISSNSYEKMETFNYLGPLVTNQNSIQKERKM
jgi:hypothetical protein